MLPASSQTETKMLSKYIIAHLSMVRSYSVISLAGGPVVFSSYVLISIPDVLTIALIILLQTAPPTIMIYFKINEN